MNRRVIGVMAALSIAIVGCGGASVPTTGAIVPSPTVPVLPTPTLLPPLASATPLPPTASPAPSSSTGHSTTGQLPPELAGTFAVHLDTTDVDHPDEAGNWFLTLDPTGGYGFGLVNRGFAENSGDLTVEGGEVSFSNETGEGACPAAPGTYSWSVDTDGSLRLKAVTDDCTVRKEQNTAHPYVRCSGGPDTCAEALKTPAPTAKS